MSLPLNASQVCIALAFLALISIDTLKLPSKPVNWIFSLPPRLSRCLLS